MAIEETTLPERPNEEGFAAFAQRQQAGDGPVTMLNLLALKPDGGMERYVEYPTRQAFLDMVSSPEYFAIAHLRSEALTKGELHPLDTLVVTLDR